MHHTYPNAAALTTPPLYDRLSTIVIDPDPHARRLIATLLSRCFPGLRVHLGTQPTPDAARDHLGCDACVLGFAPPSHADTSGPLPIDTLRSFRDRHPSAILIACLTAASAKRANDLLDAGADLICRHTAPGDLPRAVRHLQRAFEHRLLATPIAPRTPATHAA